MSLPTEKEARAFVASRGYDPAKLRIVHGIEKERPAASAGIAHASTLAFYDMLDGTISWDPTAQDADKVWKGTLIHELFHEKQRDIMRASYPSPFPWPPPAPRPRLWSVKECKAALQNAWDLSQAFIRQYAVYDGGDVTLTDDCPPDFDLYAASSIMEAQQGRISLERAYWETLAETERWKYAGLFDAKRYPALDAAHRKAINLYKKTGGKLL